MGDAFGRAKPDQPSRDCQLERRKPFVSRVPSLPNRLSDSSSISGPQYGESHYINVVNGDQPPESKIWTMNPDSEFDL